MKGPNELGQGGVWGVLKRHVNEQLLIIAPNVFGPTQIAVTVLGEAGDGWWRFVTKIQAAKGQGGIPAPNVAVLYLHVDDIRAALTTMEGADDPPVLHS